jgi:ABC-type multidrug transport system fused ATPase/permease subunit
MILFALLFVAGWKFALLFFFACFVILFLWAAIESRRHKGKLQRMAQQSRIRHETIGSEPEDYE